MMMTRSLRRFAIVPVLLMAACSEGDPTGPEVEEGTLTVHANDAFVFVRLDSEAAVPVTIADSESSEDWDIAFHATSVMLNGGAAGPGGVVGHCLCQNAGASDAAIMAMTATSELADYESVTAAQIPTEESAWASDVLDPVIEGWYSYNPITHLVSAAPAKVWFFRTASSGYAKVHVTQIVSPTQAHAGQVSVEFAVQPLAGGNYGAPQTVVLDLSSGAKHLDLETASVVPASNSGWDLSIDGYTIRVNGGVSGSGNAGALATTEAFASIAAPSSDISTLYAADTYGGAFSQHPWYRYNLTGTDHDIWPTFDVFLIRRDETVYKVQIIGYYNTTGDSRWVTFRYEKLQ